MRNLILLCCCLLLCNNISAQSNTGKYIVNGNTYTADDVIQQLYTFGNQLPDSERRFLSCIQEALRQGQTLEYNTWSYTLKGYVNWNSQLTTSQQKKYAQNGTLPKDCKQMLYHLAQFQPYNSTPASSPNKNISLDMSTPRYLTYLRNPDGTYRYTVDLDNIGVIDRLQTLKQLKRVGSTTYLNGQAVVSFKGYNIKTLEIYMRWLESYKDLDGLINRVKSATITSDDEPVLNGVGIFVLIK